MMPRKGLSFDQVLDAAAQLADREGLQSLTLARLASELHIKPPSLYNHIQSLEHLQDSLAARGMQMMIERTRQAAAGRSGKAALFAVAKTHRESAKEHPGLYTATQISVQKFSPESQKLASIYLSTILDVLQGYHLEEDKALHFIRIFRSMLKGFMDLEVGGGFGMPLKLEETFELMLETLHSGMLQYSTVKG